MARCRALRCPLFRLSSSLLLSFLPQMLHRLFGGRGQRDLRHARIEQRLFQNHAEDSVILHHKHVVRQCLG